MAILDYRGMPVNPTRLTADQATPSLSGVRQVLHSSSVSGLTPEKLGKIMAAVDQGDAQEYLTLAEEMEERDQHYRSVLSTRKLAISGLDITVEAASDDPRDVEIADAVTELTKAEEFLQLLADQTDALGKGYAVSEIEWDKSEGQWQPTAYAFRDQRWFFFDRVSGRELRLRDDNEKNVEGIALEPYKFVVHLPRLKTGLPIRGGLARLAAVGFMCKSYALKDWLAFAEVFGMPLRIGKYGAAATDAEKRELLNAVSNIGTDAAAIVPESMAIEIIASQQSNGGDKIFQGLADWLDRQTSKGVLGQTMTTDSSAAGLGSNQADVQNEVRGDIRQSDAIQLAATLRRDIVRAFVDLNFGPPKKRGGYPKVFLRKHKAEDLKLLSEALPPFINLGMRVETSVIRDKFNLPEPAKDAEVLVPQQTATPVPVAPAGDPSGTGQPVSGEPGNTTPPAQEFNGAQVASLLEFLKAAAAGELPRDVVVQNLIELYGKTPEQAERMVGSIGKGFKPTPAADSPAPSAPKAPAAPPPAAKTSVADIRGMLAQRVLDGVELTQDQRDLLQIASSTAPDEIDRLTAEGVDQWQRVMTPVLDPILELVGKASSLADLRKSLKSLKLDTADFTRSLATSTLKARGLGDVKDEV